MCAIFIVLMQIKLVTLVFFDTLTLVFIKFVILIESLGVNILHFHIITNYYLYFLMTSTILKIKYKFVYF